MKLKPYKQTLLNDFQKSDFELLEIRECKNAWFVEEIWIFKYKYDYTSDKKLYLCFMLNPYFEMERPKEVHQLLILPNVNQYYDAFTEEYDRIDMNEDAFFRAEIANESEKIVDFLQRYSAQFVE